MTNRGMQFGRAMTRLAWCLMAAVAGGPAWAQGLASEDAVSYRGFAKAPHYRAFLPQSVDLSADFPEPADQGAQGSCTAWAVGYGLRSFLDIRAGRLDRRQPGQAFSPAFIYNQIKSEPNNCLEPTRISDALKFLEERGAVTMADFPYLPNDCSRLPPQDLAGMATPHRLGRWQSVEYGQIDDVKGQLAQGRPVVFGMMTPLPFEQLSAGKVFDLVAGPKDYGHAMVLVGYDDARQAFKAFNSWGKQWGDNGFGWISYNSFRQNARSAFAADPALAAPAQAVVAAAPPEPPPPVTPPPVPVVESVAPPPVTPPPVAPLPVAPPPVEPIALPSTPPPSTSPPSTPPPALPSLEERLTGLQCASLTGTRDGKGRIRVAGYVESEGDLERLRQRLVGLPGMTAHALAVEIRPWPQCEALETLAKPMGAASGLTVGLAAKSGKARLVAGDKLVLRLRSPDFPSYLYVTYIQASGDAVHLVGGGQPVPPATVLTFGDDPRKPSFRITPPFGREMVVVVASSKPLFTDRLPGGEEERAYLSRLRQAILTNGDGRVAAATAAAITYPSP